MSKCAGVKKQSQTFGIKCYLHFQKKITEILPRIFKMIFIFLKSGILHLEQVSEEFILPYWKANHEVNGLDFRDLIWERERERAKVHHSGYLTSELSVQGEKGRASSYGAGGVVLDGQGSGWAPLWFLRRDKLDIILMFLEWSTVYFAVSPDDSV